MAPKAKSPERMDCAVRLSPVGSYALRLLQRVERG